MLCEEWDAGTDEGDVLWSDVEDCGVDGSDECGYEEGIGDCIGHGELYEWEMGWWVFGTEGWVEEDDFEEVE